MNKSYEWAEVANAALGQWVEILANYGIPFAPKGKGVPCPRCGGQDRSHWKQDAGKVRLSCRHCGTSWADQLLLELAFNNDFSLMCNELGNYLNCQPGDRRVSTVQAKVAEATNGDLALAQEKIEQAEEFAAKVTRAETHPILIRYGIGADCFTVDGFDGAAFPLKIAGQVCDWMLVGGSGQSIMSGRAARGSKLVIKPDGEPGNNIFVTPDVIDAYFLYQVSRQKSIVVCCGDLANLQPVCDSLPDRYRVIAAVSRTLDSMDRLQTMGYDFVMPDEMGQKFREVDRYYKPAKIYANAEAGEIYKLALANEDC